MNEVSRKSDLTISQDTLNATSSLASEYGVIRFARPDGQMTDPVGQDRAPANPSVMPVSEADSKMIGISGQTSSVSSQPVNLSQLLANKLRQKTDLLGSTLFKLTWKVRVTPLGRSIPALRASALRTSDKDCTSWLSPDHSIAQDGESYETWNKRRLETKERIKNGNGFGTPLTIAAQMTSWPTPKYAKRRTQQEINSNSYRRIGFGRSGDFGGVGNNNSGLEGWGLSGTNSIGGGPDEQPSRTPGFVNGFWKDAQWIPCIDGKARPAPVEPLLFPLAAGITNRVGILRGAGNALCSPQAQGFIEAYLEVEEDLENQSNIDGGQRT